MQYSYMGYTIDRQIVKGRISAASETVAMNMLSNVGYNVVSMKAITPFLPDLSSLLQASVKTSELVMFSRQMALLLDSGLGIVQSLELLQSQTGDRALKKSLIEIIADLRSGNSLSFAMAKHPHIFSRIYHKMVAVGEQTGGLEGILRSLAGYMEKQSATMSKLKTALTYPAIIAILAVAVMMIMVTVVLPPMTSMFKQLGGNLPITTQILLSFVDITQKYGLHVLIVLVASIFVLYIYSKSPGGRYNKDLLMLKLPILGRLCLLSELARCCRNMSLLFKSGLPLPEIMRLSSQASGNLVVSKALSDVEGDMLKGEGLSRPMQKRKVFLPLMVEMTRVGESTGTLDNTLVTVAENYEIESENRTQAFLSMIEPVMTIVMGLAVGFLAMSIFMPLYSSLSLIK